MDAALGQVEGQEIKDVAGKCRLHMTINLAPDRESRRVTFCNFPTRCGLSNLMELPSPSETSQKTRDVWMMAKAWAMSASLILNDRHVGVYPRSTKDIVGEADDGAQ